MSGAIYREAGEKFCFMLSVLDVLSLRYIQVGSKRRHRSSGVRLPGFESKVFHQLCDLGQVTSLCLSFCLCQIEITE